MHYELPNLKEHTASTSEIIQAIRARDYAFNTRDALLDELERRSKAGIRERLARVEQDLADFKAQHQATAPAPAPCTHSQILRESGKCAACGVQFAWACWVNGRLEAIWPKR